MYVNAIGHYVPSKRIGNEYFKEINGLDSEWIQQRTGIVTRSKVNDDEDTVTMAIDAVDNAAMNLPYPVSEVDLIVSAGYAITDTVGTTAHWIQKWFSISTAQVVAVTSGCSSFVNAVEIAQGYFAMKKAKKVLIVCSEVNSVYNNYADSESRHLWGDAAVAMFLSDERYGENEPVINDVVTKGLAHIGKGPNGVGLYPNNGGITMKDGRDVFRYACSYMMSTLEELLMRNSMTVNDVAYLVCHQANLRIVNHIADQWNLHESRFFNNIRELGNTGSASAILALSQNIKKIKHGEYIGLTVFGGGYSSGAMLIRF